MAGGRGWPLAGALRVDGGERARRPIRGAKLRVERRGEALEHIDSRPAGSRGRPACASASCASALRFLDLAALARDQCQPVAGCGRCNQLIPDLLAYAERLLPAAFSDLEVALRSRRPQPARAAIERGSAGTPRVFPIVAASSPAANAGLPSPAASLERAQLWRGRIATATSIPCSRLIVSASSMLRRAGLEVSPESLKPSERDELAAHQERIAELPCGLEALEQHGARRRRTCPFRVCSPPRNVSAM